MKIYVRLIPLQSWSVLGFTNLPSDLCEIAGTGREREASSTQPPGTLQGEEIIRVHAAPEARDFLPAVARAPACVNEPLKLL